MSAPPPGPHPPPDEGSSRDDTAPGCVLFDAAARELARQQPEEAAFRLLALSGDPEWVHLRAALERGFVLACRPGPGETAASAADTALRLRNGLATVRWGQHVGALAHLLLLTLLDAEGLGVEGDPHLDGLRPDVLAERDGRRALIEARAVTGMGRRPWARRAAGHPAHDGTPDADTAAHLRRVLGDVVLDKAHSYRELVTARALPYVVALYADTDPSLAPLLRDVAFGPATERRRRDDRWGQAPDGGLLAARRDELACVSALAVFGRRDDDDGVLRLTGELLCNPFAERPLPAALRPACWRVLAAQPDPHPDADARPAPDTARPPDAHRPRPARMAWLGPPPPPLEP